VTERNLRLGTAAVLLAASLAFGCDPTNRPETIDSQTNWLRSCQIDAQCGESKCLCGVCTKSCEDDSVCSDHPGASCVGANDEGAIAQCGGARPASPGLCMPRCDDSTPCESKQMCVAGVCTPVPEPTAHVTVDVGTLHQTLVGFGASVAYDEDEITSHPQKFALYQTVFAGLGIDILRLRDRFGHTGDDNLDTTRELVDAAATSLGHTPTLFMTSWSPPPSLKANASFYCNGNADTCTLPQKSGGGFDYTALATYFRSSLDAYAKVGIAPDYFGIQNNPDWLPTSAELGEACVFLPVEGSAVVSVKGTNKTVKYPGYAEAQTAAIKAFAGLASVPRILAPETSNYESVADYVAKLDLSQVQALSHHYYGTDPLNVDLTGIAGVGELAAANSRPIFQTEMQADGFGTALLIHYATVVESASAYLQTTLTSSVTGPAANSQALVGISDGTFTLEDPYYAFQHYALHTDPGWTRVDASATVPTLLSSAWLSPTGTAVTVVLVNGGNETIIAKVDVPSGLGANSEVTRTVFGSAEQGAYLGSLSNEHIVTLPPRGIVTVALSP